MMTSQKDTYTLPNGVKIPCLGFGTWQTPDGETAVRSVLCALEAGYTHIDTAQAYGNEESVGKAIRLSGIPRGELFITTKLWNANHSYELAMRSFEESMNKLGLDYLDLFLIHWPNPVAFRDHWQQANAESWKAMEELVDAGRVVGIPLVDHVVVGGLPDLRGPDGSIDTTRCFDLVPRFRSLRRTGAVDFDLV